MRRYRADVSEQDLLSAFDNAPVGMAVLTPSGVVTACNAGDGPPARAVRREDLVGGTFFDVTHADDLEGARRKCALMQVEGARIVRHECRFVLPGDRIIWVSVSTSRVPADPDRPAHLIMHIEDVSDRKRLEAELSHRALHDPLTGLANRTLLAERLRESLARRGRHTRLGHLFYLDLDGFKAVNDRFGHAAGDAVLTQLAHRIVALLRAGDLAARLGGDEFAVLCEDTEPQHAARHRPTAADGGGGPVRRRRLDDHALGGRGLLRDRPHGPRGAAPRGRPAHVRGKAPASSVRGHRPPAVPW